MTDVQRLPRSSVTRVYAYTALDSSGAVSLQKTVRAHCETYSVVNQFFFLNVVAARFIYRAQYPDSSNIVRVFFKGGEN